MADEANSRFSRDGQDERNPTVSMSDNIDEMVSGFLENLTDISSDTERVCQPDVDGNSEILPPPEPAKTNHTPPSDEAIRAEAKPVFDEIRDEVEETLIQLEHLNSQMIPATDQREVTEQPSPFYPTEEEQLLSEFASPPVTEPNASQSVAEPATVKPVVEPAPALPVIEPSEFSPIDGGEEEMWKQLEIFRSRDTYSSSSFFQRQKHLIFISAAVAFILVLGGLYLLWSEGISHVSRTLGQIQHSKGQYSQISNKRKLSELPLLGSSSAVVVDEARDTATALPAKEIRLPQNTGPTSTTVEERNAGKSKPAAINGVDIAIRN